MTLDNNQLININNIDDYTFISLRPLDYFYGNTTQLFEINAIVRKNDISDKDNVYIKLHYPIKMEIYFEKQKGKSTYTNTDENSMIVENTYSNVVNSETAVVVYSKSIFDRVIYVPKNLFLLVDISDEINRKEDLQSLINKHIELYNAIYNEVINKDDW